MIQEHQSHMFTENTTQVTIDFSPTEFQSLISSQSEREAFPFRNNVPFFLQNVDTVIYQRKVFPHPPAELVVVAASRCVLTVTEIHSPSLPPLSDCHDRQDWTHHWTLVSHPEGPALQSLKDRYGLPGPPGDTVLTLFPLDSETFIHWGLTHESKTGGGALNRKRKAADTSLGVKLSLF
ncbi:hypothetical protein EYF80_054016 [Liparis tanakae]|uniref:Uncharacterized protein n=1 Tax=Liparis tanakae TaxID=230148 RepID=A0A4Z2F3U3_9TELE|nr:hypothetical protein EYF80_054016 [Liparis tanakae]